MFAVAPRNLDDLRAFSACLRPPRRATMVWVAEPIRSRTKIPPRTPDFLVRVEAVILASLLALLISSPTASAQKRGAQRNAPTAEQSSPKAAAGQSSPKAAAVGLPEGNTGSPLSNALSDCDKAAEDSKPISLPGANGELKLDSCFRGRDHLVCSYNALIIE